MEPIYLPNLSDQSSLSLAIDSALSEISFFLPRLFAAVVILLVGALIARWIKKLTVRSLQTLQLSRFTKNTPVESFFDYAEMGKNIEHAIGTLIYWLLMLVVIHTTVSLLGLTSLTLVLDRILAYIPRIFSAVIVLFLGIVVSGFIESIVKGAIRSIDGVHSRVIGKISSYLTMIVFAMAAISELGIAEQFIHILFIGFIATLSVAFGLAFGLGSKDIVNNFMKDWVDSTKKELKKD